MQPSAGQSSSSSPTTSSQGAATPRRLRKLTMNRHSMFSTSSSSGSSGSAGGGFQQGGSPSPTAPVSPSANQRPAHGRSTSLLNFSFRNRAAQHQQQQQQLVLQQQAQQRQPGQQSHYQLRQGGQNGMSEFGRMSSPLAGQQRAATMDSAANMRPTLELPSSPHTNGQQQARMEGTNVNGGQVAPNSPPAQPGGPPKQLHPEIRSVVQLSVAHAHKVYFSGPLVKHTERHTDGRVVGKEEPWREVWAQLGGTTLSVWDMAEISEASKRGAEVPPTYLNVTDAVCNLSFI